jgi:hypothetical protein
MSQVSPTLPAPRFAETARRSPEWAPAGSPEWAPVDGPEIGACGLPLQPLDPETLAAWEAEVDDLPMEGEDDADLAPAPFVAEPYGGNPLIASPLVGGAVQAELSGFEDDDDIAGGEGLPPDDEEDEFDDFDDIDEDDFDDDFDDDFEEELDDDYEIEIEDEISAEFGLSGVEVDIDEIEDIDAIDDDVDADIDLDPGLDLDDKE